MRTRLAIACLAFVAFMAVRCEAEGAGAEIIPRIKGNELLIQFKGSRDHDWRLQASTNLVDWTTLTNFGTLLSGSTSSAPIRSVGPLGPGSMPSGYFRAVKSGGLYDPTLLRSIYISLPQANWQELLTLGRDTGSNTTCSIWMDNGATNQGVGARYKGNSSFLLSGTKKSINLEMDHLVEDANLMTYETINLNNAYGDQTLLREPLYFNVMEKYTACPKGSIARVYINGAYWGVYSLIQQENGQLMKEWFPSNDGDRWKTPNGTPLGSIRNSALGYHSSTNPSNYRSYYELKSDGSNPDVAWGRLINTIGILNNTPVGQLRDKVEDVMAVDAWLWFLAIENLFTDDDSYWNKGADYILYYEPESGRMHPVEHDGNESLSPVRTTLSPVQGGTANNRPVLQRFLGNAELRQRYLAHMRTVLRQHFNPEVLTPMIDDLHRLSEQAVIEDPNRGFTLTDYTNAIAALKSHVTNRYKFLTNHAELTPKQPAFVAVSGPSGIVTASVQPFITANVVGDGDSGVGSVWLYHRDRRYGRFSRTQMLDDGGHGDGATADGVYGASITNYQAGTTVQYYIEARGTNAAKAARFYPALAESRPSSYEVKLAAATGTSVVINEFMASNGTTITDPEGEFEDWIELRNITASDVDLSGCYLSDSSSNRKKWKFPAGSIIPANGYLVVWADEDTGAGLHAAFKLSATAEQVYLTDTDAHGNALLDFIIYGSQSADISFGRTASNPDQWGAMSPTPGSANQ